jgi:hydrogenase maturation protease
MDKHKSRTAPPRIRLLGLGNLMRTDDAVGMLTIQSIKNSGSLPNAIDVIAGGTLGLDLLDALYGTTHLLVLDAVDFGAEPGSQRRFHGEELSKLPTSKSVHLLGLSDLINVMLLMDAPPMEIILLGVQPESTEWGTALTPAVEASQASLIETAIAQIKLWGRELDVFEDEFASLSTVL